VRHDHVTRDVKPKGQCPACDAPKAVTPAKPAKAVHDAGKVQP
jgi:hypothetical protein